MKGCITIQDLVYIDGKVFKINEQYKFVDKVDINGSCCVSTGRGVFFQVICDNISYLIPYDNAVETTVMINPEDQSFFDVWSKDFLQNKDHHDYSEINNNCTNCNGLFVHGDYNNNVDTGGFKDPELVQKHERDS